VEWRHQANKLTADIFMLLLTLLWQSLSYTRRSALTPGRKVD